MRKTKHQLWLEEGQRKLEEKIEDSKSPGWRLDHMHSAYPLTFPRLQDYDKSSVDDKDDWS